MSRSNPMLASLTYRGKPLWVPSLLNSSAAASSIAGSCWPTYWPTRTENSARYLYKGPVCTSKQRSSPQVRWKVRMTASFFVSPVLPKPYNIHRTCAFSHTLQLVEEALPLHCSTLTTRRSRPKLFSAFVPIITSSSCRVGWRGLPHLPISSA